MRQCASLDKSEAGKGQRRDSRNRFAASRDEWAEKFPAGEGCDGKSERLGRLFKYVREQLFCSYVEPEALGRGQRRWFAVEANRCKDANISDKTRECNFGPVPAVPAEAEGLTGLRPEPPAKAIRAPSRSHASHMRVLAST